MLRQPNPSSKTNTHSTHITFTSYTIMTPKNATLSTLHATASAPGAPLEPENGDWLLLAEYGDWPHPRGLQRLSREAAEEMVRHFRSLRERLARRFGGLPLYIGHPDDPGFQGRPGHDDTRAYAWIQEMDARPNGLYIKPKWSEDGRHVLENAFYKFLSPRWSMQPLDDEADIYTPVRLISVALTNEPNIPGEAIANATNEEIDKSSERPSNDTKAALRSLQGSLMSMLELDSEAADEQTILETLKDRLDENERYYRMASHAEDKCQRQRKALEEATEAFTTERAAHIETLLTHAIQAGQVEPARLDDWRERLLENFDEASRALVSANASLKNHSLTASLNLSNQSSHQRIRELVESFRDDSGDYARAWATARRQHPEAFAHLR